MTNLEVTIRNAAIADIQALYAISTHVHGESYMKYIPEAYRERFDVHYQDTPLRRESFRRNRTEELRDPAWTYTLAETDATIAGYVCAQQKEGYTLIQGLFVRADFQGKGIGRTLLHSYLSTLASGTRVRLYVMDTNVRAIWLYEHFGFSANGTGKKAYFGVPLLRMEMTT